MKFKGRIRFSDVELGALLFALDLPKGCCHKIGMGKPHGLGSINITSQLFISNRHERYTSLFSEWEDEIKESEKERFRESFENHVLGKIQSNKKTLWEVDRLKEYKIMLNYEEGVELENRGKTEYMTIQGKNNEFRNRPVLPKPSDVRNTR